MGGSGGISATEASACQRPNGIEIRSGLLPRCRQPLRAAICTRKRVADPDHNTSGTGCSASPWRSRRRRPSHSGWSCVWPRPEGEDWGRRNILAIGTTKASPRPNMTEGTTTVVAGKASRTASPFPRLRMYGEADSASEPMPDTWMNRRPPLLAQAGRPLLRLRRERKEICGPLSA